MGNFEVKLDEILQEQRDQRALYEAEIRPQLDEIRRAVRGFNGDPGLVGRVSVLENQAGVVRKVFLILLSSGVATLLGYIIYNLR